jgi:ATP-binding cassette subfamily B protein
MKASKKVSGLRKVFRVIAFGWSISPSYVLLSLARSLVKSFIPYIPIYCSYLIIDGLVAKQEASSIMVIVYWMISLTLGLSLLKVYLEHLLQAYGQKIRVLVNRRISEKTFSLSYAQLQDQATLHLIQEAHDGSNGYGDLASFFYDYLPPILEGLLSLVYSTILLSGLFASGTPNQVDGWSAFLVNPWSALIIFGLVLFNTVIAVVVEAWTNKMSYSCMQNNVEDNRHFGYFYTLCVDYLRGKDIRLFRMQPMIDKRENREQRAINEHWRKPIRYETWGSIAVGFFDTALLFVAYGFLGLKALYGLISLGEAVSFVGAVTLLSTGLMDIVIFSAQGALTADYLQNYFLYLALPSATRYGTNHLDEKKPLSIEFKNVSFTYPNQKEKALDGVSFVIRPEEKVAIVGANGAGKTTLMKLLGRFYEPDAGEILLNDLPLKSYDAESSYRLYSIVFQDFKLFSFPIDENVAGCATPDETKVKESLQKAGIYERIMQFPDGMKTVVYNKNDENGVEISGGEAQKIAIARALYKDAPLVILDEPTSALDPKSEAEIYEKFATLVKGKSAIFISHRMSSTKFCDRILVIDQGKIEEEGDHATLLKAHGLYKKMWDAQAQYYR